MALLATGVVAMLTALLTIGVLVMPLTALLVTHSEVVLRLATAAHLVMTPAASKLGQMRFSSLLTDANIKIAADRPGISLVNVLNLVRPLGESVSIVASKGGDPLFGVTDTKRMR